MRLIQLYIFSIELLLLKSFCATDRVSSFLPPFFPYTFGDGQGGPNDARAEEGGGEGQRRRRDPDGEAGLGDDGAFGRKAPEAEAGASAAGLLPLPPLQETGRHGFHPDGDNLINKLIIKP